MTPPETTVSIFFFLEIDILTTKIVNLKSLKKLSSASANDKRPQGDILKIILCCSTWH